jgi:hypothetical protein
MYRKDAYQIGGTAATPTLTSGQLIAQLDINGRAGCGADTVRSRYFALRLPRLRLELAV